MRLAPGIFSATAPGFTTPCVARPAAPMRSPSMNSVRSMSYPFAISSGNAGFLAAIFPRRDVELGAEHASEVGGTVEPVIERDGGDGTAALRAGLERLGAGLEAAAQNIARHGLVLIREQMMQVASGHLAGLRNARRRQIRIVEMRFDVIDDADAMRGTQRGTVAECLRHVGIGGSDEIQNGHCDAGAALLVEATVVLAPVLAQQLGQQSAGSAAARHVNGGERLGTTHLAPQQRIRYAENQHAVRAVEDHLVAPSAVAEREIADAKQRFAAVLAVDALALELQVKKKHRVLGARHVGARMTHDLGVRIHLGEAYVTDGPAYDGPVEDADVHRLGDQRREALAGAIVPKRKLAAGVEARRRKRLNVCHGFNPPAVDGNLLFLRKPSFLCARADS